MTTDTTNSLTAAIDHIRRITPSKYPWIAKDLAFEQMEADEVDYSIATILNAVVSGRLIETRLAGWQPIETAPKDGSAILASGLDHGKGPSRHYSIVEWMDCGCKLGWYPDEDTIPLTYLTHWMPIPAPLSEGVGDD